MLSKLTFQVHSAHDFDAVASLWAGLNAALTGNHPFLDPGFVGPLVHHFGSKIRPDDLKLVFAHDGDRAVAALIAERIAPTVWQLFCPAQAPIPPAIFDRHWLLQEGPDSSNGSPGDFLGLLASSALGHVSVLRLTAQDPLMSPWPTVAATAAFEQRFQARTAAIDTQGGFEAYWAGRSKGLRKEMRRRLDQLGADGISPRIRVVSDPDGMAHAVDDFARIESAGWKGVAGTAVSPGGLQHAFYREIMSNFAGDGGAAVYQLHLGERIVASQMTLHRSGMRVILKTTFDEQFRSYGVGRVADYLAYQLMFGDPATHSIEMYTNASADDLRWATSERTVVNVLWYSSTLARRGVRIARSLIAQLHKLRSLKVSRVRWRHVPGSD